MQGAEHGRREHVELRAPPAAAAPRGVRRVQGQAALAARAAGLHEEGGRQTAGVKWAGISSRFVYMYRVNRQVAYNLLLKSIYDIAHWPRLDWKQAEGADSAEPVLNGCGTLKLCQQKIVSDLAVTPVGGVTCIPK